MGVPNSESPEYRAWGRMKRRCLDPKYHAYKFYGARGVSVCDAWVNSFPAFFSEVGHRPTPKHSLDRIDTTRGYEPGNCRWATRLTQANNRTDNIFVSYRGKRMTLTEAWRAAGCVCSNQSLFKRISNGWDVRAAVETPPNPKLQTRARQTFRNKNATTPPAEGEGK